MSEELETGFTSWGSAFRVVFFIRAKRFEAFWGVASRTLKEFGIRVA